MAAIALLDWYESVLTGLRIELVEVRVERDVLRGILDAQAVVAAAPMVARVIAPKAPKTYSEKPCLGCRQPFMPRSGSAQRCDPCRLARFAEQRRQYTTRP